MGQLSRAGAKVDHSFTTLIGHDIALAADARSGQCRADWIAYPEVVYPDSNGNRYHNLLVQLVEGLSRQQFSVRTTVCCSPCFSIKFRVIARTEEEKERERERREGGREGESGGEGERICKRGTRLARRHDHLCLL